MRTILAVTNVGLLLGRLREGENLAAGGED